MGLRNFFFFKVSDYTNTVPTTTTEDTTTLAKDIIEGDDEPLDEEKQMILRPLLESCLKLGSEILELIEGDEFDFLMNITNC